MPRILKIVILVILASVGAIVFRAVFVAASQPGPARPPAMDRVRVAAADLPEGMLLRESDLAWKEVPHKQVLPGALVKSDADSADATDLKGDVLRHAVTAGTMLGTADVIAPNAPGFLAAALKPGMRATSVAIDDVSGNAGLIQPGDYVDVLLTQQLDGPAHAPQNTARSVESETVVNRVRVLAVGSLFQRPKSDTPDANTRARTVTFEVTPHTAQVIAVATHLGSLSLALRSFATSDRTPPITGNETLPQSPPVWAGDVSRALSTVRVSARSAAGPAPDATHAVIVYRGSKVSDAAGETRLQGSTGAAGLPPLPANPPTTVAGQNPSPEQPTTQR
ncbi:Flp pilus assembly protein CpaB [Paraburkholderia sp. HP33-1]|uniref:Flp pilus assembly protein CpaB n=1 Tax=Paraburkholderia sp. HP33-1 TaxID=2883243 RepID=UPI001F22E076|nr:Flp pilus assembly protein CpaB [Paraburkholderia sp. HP33-1]